jgi:tyrosyl-DNA phosphodiesterase-1
MSHAYGVEGGDDEEALLQIAIERSMRESDDGGLSAALQASAEEAAVESCSKRARLLEPASAAPAPLWRLSCVKEMSDRDRCPSLDDLMSGDFQSILISSFLTDIEFLCSSCPRLLHDQVNVLLVSGEKRIEDLQPAPHSNFRISKPRLDSAFASNHSKFLLMHFPGKGLRFVLTTANLIHCDWAQKTQGVFYQDFPEVSPGKVPSESDFGSSLVAYLQHLSERIPDEPSASFMNNILDIVSRIDFSSATCVLVPSVPGNHTGNEFGQARVKHVLMKEPLPHSWTPHSGAKDQLLMQFSSFGSVKEPYLSGILDSFSACSSTWGSERIPKDQLQIVWPTCECIRQSLEGWMGGGTIPGSSANVKQGFLKDNLHAYEGARGRAAPHIKSFCRYRRGPGPDMRPDIAWWLLASHNVSSFAWGNFTRKGLRVQNFELGVLFLPSLCAKRQPEFSCHENGPLAAYPLAHGGIVTASGALSLERMPVPYDIPPRKYGAHDEPWTTDSAHMEPDMKGVTCSGRNDWKMK